MNKTKIIWIVNQYAVLPNSFGVTRHFDLANQIKNPNWHFIIFSSSYNSFEKKETRSYSESYFEKQSIGKNIEFYWIKTRPYKTNGILRIINMISFTKKLHKVSRQCPKPNLVIGSSPHLLSAYRGYNLAKKYKVPFVFEIRDIWPQALIELGVNKYNPLMIIFKIIEIILMKKSTRIIALMPFLKQYVKENFKIDLSKIIWISNGVADRYIKPYTPPPRRKKIIFTYSGTIGKAQNIENIIYTASLLKDNQEINFHLIGNGVEKGKLIKLAQKLKVEDTVKFYNPLPKNKIFTKLRNSDFLIFALKKSDVYRFGNPPNKLFDYMAAGRPIIFSSSAKNNLVKEAGCGLSIDPTDELALKKAILKMAKTSPKNRANMGEKGIEFVKNNYSISKLAPKLSKIIETTST